MLVDVSPLGGTRAKKPNNLASGLTSLETARRPQHLSPSSLHLITADASTDAERLSTNPTALLVALCHASSKVLWEFPAPEIDPPLLPQCRGLDIARAESYNHPRGTQCIAVIPTSNGVKHLLLVRYNWFEDSCACTAPWRAADTQESQEMLDW
jgi:hypothetical protein